MHVKDTVISNIKKLRAEKNLTQAQLAELIDGSHSHIRQVESGQSAFSLEALEKIAAALEVPVYYLFTTKGDSDQINKWRLDSFNVAMDKIGFGVDANQGSTIKLSMIRSFLSVIPDDVFEMAQKLGGPDSEAWETVRAAMEHEIEELEASKKSKNA